MDIANILFSWSWCSQPGVKGVLDFVRTIVDIIRIVVPIVLIIMTTIDITKKVIDPEDKDGQKKIMTRAIAALIIFLIPIMIKIVFKVIDWGMGTTGSINSSESCWR